MVLAEEVDSCEGKGRGGSDDVVVIIVVVVVMVVVRVQNPASRTISLPFHIAAHSG